MAKHRIHSIEFKRQVAQEFLAGKTLHGLAPAQRGLPFDFATKPASSLLVSLADKVDNAEAILNDYRSIGDDL